MSKINNGKPFAMKEIKWNTNNLKG
jgi:hypothetical protein